MSRRDSRVSMGARQNDALVEFENFKKKFLLANKHITKLNSTLSMKIEELNTEISTLYSENLRLRASEIALTTELKREREKSRKMLSDAEAAAQALGSHLAALRDTYNVPLLASPTTAHTTPSPRNSMYRNNPTINRLSREPQVPNINEDEEPEDVQGSPPRKTKKKPRLSASRLPLPARSSTPPTEVPPLPAPLSIPLDLSNFSLPTKKRRQSGLLLDLAVVDLDALEVDDGQHELERDRERLREKERKRSSRDSVEVSVKPKAKLKDVTNANSPRARTKSEQDALQPEPPAQSQSPVQSRAFLVAASPSPPPPEPQPLPTPEESQPVSSGSSSSLERETGLGSGELDSAEAGGRERRVRKSVNYAEPKLNTKMRKPAGGASVPASGPVKRSRSSTSSVPVSTRRSSPPLQPGHGDGEDYLVDEEDGDGEESDVWADGEYMPPGWASTHVNLEGRRRVQHGGRRKEVAIAGNSGDLRRHSSAM
ncbi:hypothetical protein C8F01DRAFT_1252254 [Mycena amicta]|nr:hypothetical protein C8F01DRAFT_1252254 [Mycena amicta]